MAAYTFLGEPPASIKQWILEHSTPPGPAPHADTRFTLQGGTTESKNISGTLDGDWFIDNGYYDYDNNTWLKTIIQADIGNTVTSLGNAFQWCDSLTSVTIPDSVTSIGEYAFSGCRGLTSVTIGNHVTSIGSCAFYNCSKLTSVTIPDNVTSIGNYAFFNCYSLTSVTIPSNVTSIDMDAFQYCTGITSVTFNSFTKNQVKTMTTENHIFGSEFRDPETWDPMAKSFTAVCTDGSMTISFDTEGNITFTDL